MKVGLEKPRHFSSHVFNKELVRWHLETCKTVNEKRVQRVRRREGLSKSKSGNERRGGLVQRVQNVVEQGELMRFGVGISCTDMTEHGGRFRVLNLIDEYTRRCLMLRAGWSMRSQDVISNLEEAITMYGAPEHTGQCPSVRELSTTLGNRSSRSGMLLLNALVDKGILRRTSGKRLILRKGLIVDEERNARFGD